MRRAQELAKALEKLADADEKIIPERLS